MSEPTDWAATPALARLSPVPWRGAAWRAHRRRYRADDPGGALRVSGRYNRGLDQFPDNECWPALYLGLGSDVCLGEILRHISPELLPQLNDYRLSELAIELEAVLDYRALDRLGLSSDALCHDTDYRVTQALAAAAVARRVEGILVPSCTRLGDNLILFPTQLRANSMVTILGSRDPRLYIPR